MLPREVGNRLKVACEIRSIGGDLLTAERVRLGERIGVVEREVKLAPAGNSPLAPTANAGRALRPPVEVRGTERPAMREENAVVRWALGLVDSTPTNTESLQ